MLVCGLDEVGRGAIAGPLLAVAAIFRVDDRSIETKDSPIEGIDDSKKLTPTKRRNVFQKILKDPSLVDFGIGEVSSEEIDLKGITWANEIAFARAFRDLRRACHLVLLDGENSLMGCPLDMQKYCPKADGLWWPVGGASILAKVIRDSFMAELDADLPDYHWKSNAGYGSNAHYDAIRRIGPSKWHRKRFIKDIYADSSVQEVAGHAGGLQSENT